VLEIGEGATRLAAELGRRVLADKADHMDFSIPQVIIRWEPLLRRLSDSVPRSFIDSDRRSIPAHAAAP